MDIKRLYRAAEKELSHMRWEHTVRVAQTAVQLANQLGLDKERVEAAAVLHDFCKGWDKERLAEWMRKYNLLQEYEMCPKVWHAFVGAEVAREEFHITDEEILNAIRYHTSGRPGMSLFEKVVYLADYIEPGRVFAGAEEVRRLAFKDIDQAMLSAMNRTIIFLIRRNQIVLPLTLQARNDILSQTSDS